MERITESYLKALVARINKVCGTPPKPYVKNAEGAFAPCLNCYHLDYAYGGVELIQMCSTEGAVKVILPRGTKRDLYNRMRAFLAGLETRNLK